ncbi:MAG: N-6 DNA methylase [Calditrichota bacterium]
MGLNLELIIQDHAKFMAGSMVKAAVEAESEEDIRHEVNKLIDDFIGKADLTIRGRHEYGLAGGRIDSKYGGVVIEYKMAKGAGRITRSRNAPGFKAVVNQVSGRFRDLQAEEHVSLERILGVGCDGETFVYIRYRGNQFEVDDPQPVSPYTVERLLRAIVSLGARGLSFNPDNLARLFGSESNSAQNSVRLIYQQIHETNNPKAQTFFHQWQILFGEVCGYDIHGQNAKINKLADHYAVSNPNPAELLFAVHTYYAIFIKMLAAEIVASFSPLVTSALKKLVNAPTSTKLREELKNLEQGGIWSQLGIRNFLEGDLFSWYLDAWNDDCAEAIHVMVESLNQFDPTTLSVDPAESRDLLKQLYQQLFPKSVRHDLGEYYTPDWLAELVLDELGYDGNPDKRLLDPACGSGTFLVLALNRVKSWYEEHRHECCFGEDELLRKILRNIIGFDLNPLAVMAARTNYLMAIRDLLRQAGDVELPVYLCDSIMAPKDYSTTEAHFRYIRLNTAVGAFHISKKVVAHRTILAKYADILELCVRDRYSPEDFLIRCETEGMPIAQDEKLHLKLYNRLQSLDADNQNGIWARILKNAFAPLFIGKVDYVAGNPPWVNWESLPEEYRDGMKPLWQEYGLFSLSGSAGRLGGGKKDLSMLFVYSAVDNYLDVGGRLGFVITQSVFKTQGAGDGFRQLHFNKDDKTFYITPLKVEDLSAMQVFEGATNRTAVFICEKQTHAFKFPIKYTIWRGPSRIAPEVSLAGARSLVNTSELGALPVDLHKPSSPWLTAPNRALSGLKKVIGRSDYKAYEGVNTGGLNGCFWIRIIDRRPNGDLLIENLHDVGKIKVKQVQAVIEPDLVYPLLRGRDVRRWHAEPSAYIILAQDPQTRKGIPESEMKRRWHKTFAYLKQFEGDPKKPERGTLRGRSVYRKYFKPTDPFYSMYGVGPYTMAKWKVVWREQSSFFQAAFASPGSNGTVLPDHKLMLVSCLNRQEANFIMGLLNSSSSQLAICSYIISTSTSTHVLENIYVPKFNNNHSEHLKLAQLSRQCHIAAAKGDTGAVAAIEAEINRLAANIWGITDDELRAIQDALLEMGFTRNESEPDGESKDEELN